MRYNEMRNNLWSMMEELQGAGFTIKDLYNTDNGDKTTTLWDSVQGLFDDTFEEQLTEELAKENAYWDKVDEAYERSRDER